jgi:hypothetical protein
LVEQLIRNQQVAGSSPIAGSIFPRSIPGNGSPLSQEAHSKLSNFGAPSVWEFADSQIHSHSRLLGVEQRIHLISGFALQHLSPAFRRASGACLHGRHHHYQPSVRWATIA